MKDAGTIGGAFEKAGRAVAGAAILQLNGRQLSTRECTRVVNKLASMMPSEKK